MDKTFAMAGGHMGASVLALGAVSMIFRLLMNAAGLRA